MYRPPSDLIPLLSTSCREATWWGYRGHHPWVLKTLAVLSLPSQKWNSSVKHGNGLWPVCLKKTLAFIENFTFDVWSFLYSEDWRVLWKTAYILLMHASGLARSFGRPASVSCDNLPFYAFTTMIISLRKTVPRGNADRKGDKQASLSLIFTIVLWNSCPNPNLPISRYSTCSENF